MPSIKNLALCLLVPAAFSLFTGCQQDTASTKKTGTYAAARHNTIGSNIPQRNSADSTGSTYDPDQFQNFQQQQGLQGSRGFSGGSR